MAKAGVGYDEVARAADALLGRGIEPTNRAVRAEVEQGGARPSASTIHKHLTAWRVNHPQAAPVAPELPAALQRAIQDELRRQTAEARADVEARLVSAQGEAEDLARAGEKAEAEVIELQEQVVGLTTERDQLAGKASEQLREIERLQQLVDLERRNVEAARVDLAKEKLRAEGQTEALASQTRQVESLREDLAAERTGRINAERELAAAAAARDTQTARGDELRKQLDTATRDRDLIQKTLDGERESHTTTQKQLASKTAEAKAAIERADDLKQREDLIRKELDESRKASGASAEKPNNVGKKS